MNKPFQQEINFTGSGPNVANLHGNIVIHRNPGQSKDVVKQFRLEPDFNEQVGEILIRQKGTTFTDLARKGLELVTLFEEPEAFNALKENFQIIKALLQDKECIEGLKANIDIVFPMIKRLPKKI